MEPGLLPIFRKISFLYKVFSAFHKYVLAKVPDSPLAKVNNPPIISNILAFPANLSFRSMLLLYFSAMI